MARTKQTARKSTGGKRLPEEVEEKVHEEAKRLKQEDETDSNAEKEDSRESDDEVDSKDVKRKLQETDDKEEDDRAFKRPRVEDLDQDTRRQLLREASDHADLLLKHISGYRMFAEGLLSDDPAERKQAVENTRIRTNAILDAAKDLDWVFDKLDNE